MDVLNDILLGFMKKRKIDRKTGIHILSDDHSLFFERLESLIEIFFLNDSQLVHAVRFQITGKRKYVTLFIILLQQIADKRLDPLGRVRFQPQFQGNLIRRFKSHPPNIMTGLIRIGFENVKRFISVLTVDLGG